MVALLIILAFLAVLGGLATVSQATLGAFLAGVACFFAILARIAQASEHHSKGGPAAR